MKLIKFKIRKDLAYLLVYYIFTLLREVITILLESTFKYPPHFIYFYLKALGEIVRGLIIFFINIIIRKRNRKLNILELN